MSMTWEPKDDTMAVLIRSKKYTVDFAVTIRTIVYPPETVKTRLLTLTTHGDLTIGQGWQFDGATWIPDRTKTVMRAAMCHDAIYELIRQGRLEKAMQGQADSCFLCMCMEDGIPRWRANFYYFVLSKIGHLALTPRAGRHIFINTSEG